MSPSFYQGWKRTNKKKRKSDPVFLARPRKRKEPINPSLSWLTSAHQDLFVAILQLKTKDDVARFFRDLMTKDELNEFANRWKVAKMLSTGASYLEIKKTINMSTRTIARISAWLKKGAGGYPLVLARLGPKPNF